MQNYLFITYTVNVQRIILYSEYIFMLSVSLVYLYLHDNDDSWLITTILVHI